MRLRVFLALLLIGSPGVTEPLKLTAQVQVRVGDPRRATYSELHEALKVGTPAADSVQRIFGSMSPRRLWGYLRAAVQGKGDWNSGLLALTRLAELRTRAYADSAARLQQRLKSAEFPPFPENPGLRADDVQPSLQAILLERRRLVEGDSAVLADILRRIPSKEYNHGDAWVLGRLGAGAVDSVATRFRTADSEEFRVRYLTLLSYFTDPALIPLLTQVYVSPDSFGIPKRYAIRASDGLLWIGTRKSLEALLQAREEARRRRVYADSSLARGGYDFLANDSSAVISRTGQWLTTWLDRLPTGPTSSKEGWTEPDSAAAGGPGLVAGAEELFVELALGRHPDLRMALPEVGNVGFIIGHAGDPAKDPEETIQHRPSPRRASPAPLPVCGG